MMPSIFMREVQKPAPNLQRSWEPVRRKVGGTFHWAGIAVPLPHTVVLWLWPSHLLTFT